ncbi:MAG TPA: HAMP domain-containing sensor histidine kinase [Euzebyales bacterium]|nr:HAMP domain-containing sensor histidine kinase [Euzebyales bacterium]
MGRRVAAVVLVVLLAPVAVGLVLASRLAGSEGVAAVAVVWLLVAAVIVGALAVLARTWAPIRGVIAAAGRLADGDYSARAADQGPVMTRPVVSSFNRMAARLQEADAQRRQLLADLGHELRTPLTVLRGDLEAMVDGVRPMDDEHLRALLDDVAMLERLLDDLRTLSLAESGALVLDREPTDLGRLAGDVVDRFGRLAASVDVRLCVDTADDLQPVDIDPVRIREVVSNLVVNAIGATPPGGTVTVTVRGDGPRAIVTVHDTGVGIPPDVAMRVFDRFHKGSGSSGTGLGLTISRDLVAAHEGTLTIAETSPAGTTMRVELPVGRDA